MNKFSEAEIEDITKDLRGIERNAEELGCAKIERQIIASEKISKLCVGLNPIGFLEKCADEEGLMSLVCCYHRRILARVLNPHLASPIPDL